MSLLHKKLDEVVPPQIEIMKNFVKNFGDEVVDSLTVKQVYGGLRGVKSIICDTSEVPPDKGLIIRGIELHNLIDRTPEEILWLLLTNTLPTEEETEDLRNELRSRSKVPEYVWKVIDALPENSHPMTMFNSAILSMQQESVFSKQYSEGLQKNHYGEATLEDLLNIVAKVNAIGAYVYRKKYNKGPRIEYDNSLDWSGNFVHMTGLDDPNGDFSKLMRLYFTVHTDHEGGNVSSFTASVVSSALSDLYYAISAGLNGLAGPLHGLANQECLNWILETMDTFGGIPTEEQLEKFAWETLDAGRVIPGYGHAVLRITDPRFAAFMVFGKKYLPNDPVFKTVSKVYDVVPDVLKQIKKIADPWPNVDAISGSLIYYYGMKETNFYTVLFAIARTIGLGSQCLLARAYGMPIIRPKSLPREKYRAMFNQP